MLSRVLGFLVVYVGSTSSMRVSCAHIKPEHMDATIDQPGPVCSQPVHTLLTL